MGRAVSGVDDRPLDAVCEFLDGGFRQADENRLGHRRGRDIDLDFNRRSADADRCASDMSQSAPNSLLDAHYAEPYRAGRLQCQAPAKWGLPL